MRFWSLRRTFFPVLQIASFEMSESSDMHDMSIPRHCSVHKLGTDRACFKKKSGEKE